MVCRQWDVASRRPRTLGADTAYDDATFVDQCRVMHTTPHVTQNTARPGGSAIDARTTRHEGYGKSQHARPRVERVFAWCKTIGGLRKVKQRGLERVNALVVFTSAAFNLVRLRSLVEQEA